MSLQLNSLIMSDKQAGMEVIMAESIIKVENLVKSFGDHEVLKKIDFEISKGDQRRNRQRLHPAVESR